MIRRTASLLVLALLPACGARQAEDPTGATTTTSTGDDGTEPTPTTGGTTSTSDTGATTSMAATTGDPTGDVTTGGGTTTTSDAGSSTSSDTSSTTGSDETAAPVELVTKAWWVDGAESLQIRIIQADPGAGICRGVWLTVLDLGPNGFDPVELPAPWHVRHIWVHQDLDDCFDPYLWFEDEPSYAKAATGTVIFHDQDEQGKPATIDIDVTGNSYEPVQPWVPAEDPMTATAVPVVVG